MLIHKWRCDASWDLEVTRFLVIVLPHSVWMCRWVWMCVGVVDMCVWVCGCGFVGVHVWVWGVRV